MENIILKLIGLYLNTLRLFSAAQTAKHGTFLFCFPPRKKMSTLHKDYLNNAVVKNMDVNGDIIKLYKWGRGTKTMLLVHGWGSHSFRWKKYIDQFDLNAYTVFAIDSPGHGLSSGNQFHLPKMGKVINAVIQELGEIDIMIGHSIGAFSCLYTLHTYKTDKIGRLILLASPGSVIDWLDMYKKKMKLSKKAEQAILDKFEKQFGKNMQYFQADKFAKELKIDGLIIHDVDDPDTALTYSKAIHKSWKQSRMITTEGKGHKLNQPDIIKIIKDYIEEGEVSNLLNVDADSSKYCYHLL